MPAFIDRKNRRAVIMTPGERGRVTLTVQVGDDHSASIELTLAESRIIRRQMKMVELEGTGL